jgi:hypothetical protein
MARQKQSGVMAKIIMSSAGNMAEENSITAWLSWNSVMATSAGA